MMGLRKLSIGLSQGLSRGLGSGSAESQGGGGPSYPAPWAYWPLVATLGDFSGNDRDLSGTGTFEASGGVLTGYGYASAVNASRAAATGPVSLSGWMLFSGDSGDTTLIQIVYGTAPETGNISISYKLSDGTYPSFESNGPSYTGDANPLIGWHHVGWTLDTAADQLVLYVDGQSVASGTMTQDPAGTLAIAPSDGDSPLAELALWDSALTAAQMESVYDQGSAGNPLMELGSPPVASFTASPLTGDQGMNVTTTNTSTGTIDSYLWELNRNGGGWFTTSTSASPVLSLGFAGVYSVRLTVSNAFGVSTQTRTNYITVNDGGGP